MAQMTAKPVMDLLCHQFTTMRYKLDSTNLGAEAPKKEDMPVDKQGNSARLPPPLNECELEVRLATFLLKRPQGGTGPRFDPTLIGKRWVESKIPGPPARVLPHGQYSIQVGMSTSALWDQLLDLIETAATNYRADYGPESVVVVDEQKTVDFKVKETRVSIDAVTKKLDEESMVTKIKTPPLDIGLQHCPMDLRVGFAHERPTPKDEVEMLKAAAYEMVHIEQKLPPDARHKTRRSFIFGGVMRFDFTEVTMGATHSLEVELERVMGQDEVLEAAAASAATAAAGSDDAVEKKTVPVTLRMKMEQLAWIAADLMLALSTAGAAGSRRDRQ
jgi:hypothetical protein